MTDLLANINLALPEMIILTTACVALLGDLFLRKRWPSVTLQCACLGLVLAGGVNVLFLDQMDALLLNGLFLSDHLAHLMKAFICLIVFFSFCYAHSYLNERQMPRGDYYVLGLFSTLGMMILVSAHSLLTVYLGLELLSLPLYAMTAIRRSSGDASEAALKYFIMGAIASGMLLYGMSLLYGATGQLDLMKISENLTLNWQENQQLIVFALVFIVAGVAFKLAAVPFHAWAPDVYQGAPTTVALFISAAPKIAAMGMLLRLLLWGLPSVVVQWQQLILVLALLSVGLGNLLAVTQTNIKRLLAYSAISHAGFALFGVLAASAEGFSAAVYYVLVYALMTAAAFGLLALLSRQGADVELVSDLKGLNQRNPWLAFMMLITMFSMAGVPPTVGFFTKMLVLKALVDIQMIWVAVVGLLFAVVGAFYYLRIVKVMYFEDAEHPTAVVLSRGEQWVLSVNSLALLILGIFPDALIATCRAAFAI